MFLDKILDDPIGRIVFSILLGFGLATLFRKACAGNNCIIINGPPIKEINDNVYKIDDDCYKYTPETTSCEN